MKDDWSPGDPERRRGHKHTFTVDSWAEVAVIAGLIVHVVVLTAFFVKIQNTAELAEKTADQAVQMAAQNTATMTDAFSELREQNAADAEWRRTMAANQSKMTVVLEQLVRIVYSNHPAVE